MLSDNLLKKLDELTARYGTAQDKLLPILIEMQKANKDNYISAEMIDAISERLNLPRSVVYGTATFYPMLYLYPQPKYVIEICHSAPCHITGATEVIKAFEEALGIKMGENTNDNLFGLRYVSCFGACDISPAVRINGKVYGNLTPVKVFKLIEKYKEGDNVL